MLSGGLAFRFHGAMVAILRKLLHFPTLVHTRIITYRDCRKPFHPRETKLETSNVSIDAFDTLITRTVWHPTDVFLIVGLILQRQSSISVSAEQFKHERIRAEQDCRRASE